MFFCREEKLAVIYSYPEHNALLFSRLSACTLVLNPLCAFSHRNYSEINNGRNAHEIMHTICHNGKYQFKKVFKTSLPQKQTQRWKENERHFFYSYTQIIYSLNLDYLKEISSFLVSNLLFYIQSFMMGWFWNYWRINKNPFLFRIDNSEQIITWLLDILSG